MTQIVSLGTLNKQKKSADTHPLTWRLQEDGQTINLRDYLKKDGYQAIKKALKEKTPQDICQEVLDAQLTGRGGAGFLTGKKWQLTQHHPDKAGVIICNADEMEPNAFKDRVFLEQLPHLLIEGMLLAGYANHADCGYIYLRGEYIDAAKIIQKSLDEAYHEGFLGDHIFESDFSFSIHLHTGAGRYICGEETALMNSLEGRRPNPRFKPPFPGQAGLWGRPTVVNNVETLCNVPAIIKNGAHWYHGLKCDVSKDHGTKIMGLSGRVKNPGLWELPMGTLAYDIFQKYGGGMDNGLTLKAWQPGGASTGFLKGDDLHVPMSSEQLKNRGRSLGTAIIMAVGNDVNMVDLLHNIESFFARESCGWCTPCREGLPWTVKILNALRQNKASKKDLESLIANTNFLKTGFSFCGLAPGSVAPLVSALDLFKDEFLQAVVN